MSFDLKEFRAGRHAVARDGEQWRFSADCGPNYPGYSVVAIDSEGTSFRFYENGRFFSFSESKHDLVEMVEQDALGEKEWGKMMEEMRNGV